MTGNSPRTIQVVNGFDFFLRQLHLDARCDGWIEEYELNLHTFGVAILRSSERTNEVL